MAAPVLLAPPVAPPGLISWSAVSGSKVSILVYYYERNPIHTMYSIISYCTRLALVNIANFNFYSNSSIPPPLIIYDIYEDSYGSTTRSRLLVVVYSHE